jgi:hypothetical protein
MDIFLKIYYKGETKHDDAIISKNDCCGDKIAKQTN